MKKWLLGTMAVMLAVGLVGCDMTDEQVQMVAQNAGLAAAVTWIGYDNPDTNALALVSEVVTIVEEKAGNVATGITYTAAIFPEVQKFVASGKVPAQYKPVVLAGSLAMLNGIDMVFVMKPQWKTKEGLALKIVQSFCVGAKQGLSLSSRDPLIVNARKFSEQRSRVMKGQPVSDAARMKYRDVQGNGPRMGRPEGHGPGGHGRPHPEAEVEK
jgi:hypothetical protein